MDIDIEEVKQEIWQRILQERSRQDALVDAAQKSGLGWHHWTDKSAPEIYKLAVTGEEFGEVNKAIVEGKPDELETELIQLAACVVAWLEGIQVAKHR